MSLFDPEPVASPSERVALSSSRTSSLKSIESSTSTPPTVTPRPDDPTPSDSCRSSSPSSNVPTTSIQGSDTGPAPGKYDTSQNQEDAPPQSGSFGSALSTLFNFHRPTISLPKMRFESRDPQTPPSQLASREGALSGDQAPSFDGGKPANGKRTTDERPSSDEQAPKRRIKEVYVYYPDGITGDSDHIDVVASSSLDAEVRLTVSSLIRVQVDTCLSGENRQTAKSGTVGTGSRLLDYFFDTVKENNERWELARTQCFQAEELISQYQTETSSLREQVESSKENETSVVGELILSKQESVDKSIRIAFLESQFEQQEKNLERITKEYEESLESKLTELESANNEVVELDRERVTLSETIQRHENTIQALQQQTSNNKTTWDRERATLSETIQQHEKDFQSKSTELETANRELTELRQVTRPENVQRDENTIQALQLQMGNNQTTWD
ncbi:hypothetical protein K435DRAFT_813911, partial [Dendrothele bispora CBS 962.96]